MKVNYLLPVFCFLSALLAVAAAYACSNITAKSVRCPSGGTEITFCYGIQSNEGGAYSETCAGGGDLGYNGNFDFETSNGSQISGYSYPNCSIVRTCTWKPNPAGGVVHIDPDGTTHYAKICTDNTTVYPGIALISGSCGG